MITNSDESSSKLDSSEAIVSEDIQIDVLGNLMRDAKLEETFDGTLPKDRLDSDTKNVESQKSTTLTNPRSFGSGSESIRFRLLIKLIKLNL